LDIELASLLFPEGLLDLFEIKKISTKQDKIHFYLEEKNELPTQFKQEPAVSKGFLDEVIIEDFPLRGKSVFLHVKRRRWTLKDSGKIVKRDWSLAAKGTKMTAEFADFLKDIIG
jgi:transposase